MSVDILEFDLPSLNVIPDEVIPDLNMLRLEMLYRVERNLDGTFIVTQRGTLSQMTPYSFKVCLIHKSCAQQLPAATYSASMDERDTQLASWKTNLPKSNQETGTL